MPQKYSPTSVQCSQPLTDQRRTPYAFAFAAATITLTRPTVHQVKIARPTLMFAHPDNVSTALDTISISGLSQSRLILIEGPSAVNGTLPTVESLLREHENFPPYDERRFKAGEARTTIAFLCFSSGTTGLPKARNSQVFNG